MLGACLTKIWREVSSFFKKDVCSILSLLHAQTSVSFFRVLRAGLVRGFDWFRLSFSLQVRRVLRRFWEMFFLFWRYLLGFMLGVCGDFDSFLGFKLFIQKDMFIACCLREWLMEGTLVGNVFVFVLPFEMLLWCLWLDCFAGAYWFVFSSFLSCFVGAYEILFLTVFQMFYLQGFDTQIEAFFGSNQVSPLLLLWLL